MPRSECTYQYVLWAPQFHALSLYRAVGTLETV